MAQHDGWLFGGEKFAGTRKITREIAFEPVSGQLQVTDSSDREVTSRFNVHPDVHVSEVTEHELILVGKKGSLRIRHNVTRMWRDGWVATADFTRTPIRQLELVGNPVTVRFDLPPSNTTLGIALSDADNYPMRRHLADRLARKYARSHYARYEWPSRFVKARLAMLAGSGIAVTALLVAPAAGWVMVSTAALLFVADALSEGFIATVFLSFALEQATEPKSDSKNGS
jgi:hypothetical protein